jgi:hypothetical protein
MRTCPYIAFATVVGDIRVSNNRGRVVDVMHLIIPNPTPLKHALMPLASICDM